MKKKVTIAFVIIGILAISTMIIFSTYKSSEAYRKAKAKTQWECSVVCAEKSTPDSYVITYSDAKILSNTGVLTVQNRNDFDITVHLLCEGKQELVSDSIPAGGCYSFQNVTDKEYTVGIHAEVDENTDIKAFVYDGDLSREGITDPAMLKKITGGDDLKAEFKGKDVINFKFTGVYAMACNDLPTLMGDHAEHMYNRVQILPCNNVIPKEKRNKFLVEDIINNDSQYVINWALEGLYRLIKNNYEFTYCEDVEKTREHYKTVSDTVFAFISEKYEVTGEPKDRIPVSILRTEYASYCIEEGITKPVNKKKEFIKRCEAIKGLVFGKVKVDCIKGLKVKEFEEVDEESPFEDTNNIGEVTEEIEENEIAPWDRE